ncbi:MAG: hypothetical protein JWM82_72, partial [Myxococcales bacterium]|nr:hypothetical protein [Myxococcales bacterium]
MSDVEDRLRSAMSDSVSQIRPPDGLMGTVRARHRRRRMTI